MNRRDFITSVGAAVAVGIPTGVMVQPAPTFKIRLRVWNPTVCMWERRALEHVRPGDYVRWCEEHFIQNSGKIVQRVDTMSKTLVTGHWAELGDYGNVRLYTTWGANRIYYGGV